MWKWPEEPTVAEKLLLKLHGWKALPRKSKYTGVHFKPKEAVWCVRLQYGSKGLWKTCASEEEAARIYDVCMDYLYPGKDLDGVPSAAGTRKGYNFDGEPPAGVSRAQILQWLYDAGLLHTGGGPRRTKAKLRPRKVWRPKNDRSVAKKK